MQQNLLSGPKKTAVKGNSEILLFLNKTLCLVEGSGDRESLGGSPGLVTTFLSTKNIYFWVQSAQGQEFQETKGSYTFNLSFDLLIKE
jgi:hypothetical protein